MKKIFVLLLILFFGDLVFAQVNSFVGVVRPQKTENAMKFDEEKMQETINKNKAKSSQKKKDEEKDEEEDEEEEKDSKDKENQGYDKKINTKMFGSGFIYVAPDGKNYVITNRHVVGDAELVAFELIDPKTGEKTLYDDLPVLCISDVLDLAIISLKDKKLLKEGIEFYKGLLKDGTEVYSAGFPSLQKKPSWQFSKGNISNGKAEIEELIDPSVSYVIQHTAPIDSGNSGGPLLIPDSESKLGYKLVGVNTWKARSRDLAGFTIPAQTVQKFLDSAFNPEKDQEKVVKETAEEFCKILSKYYEWSYGELGSTSFNADAIKYISNEYASSITYEQFNRLNTLIDVRSWYYENNYSVTDRKSALVRLVDNKYRFVKKGGNSSKPRYYKYKVESVIAGKDNTYEVTLVCKEDKKDNTVKSTWIKEFGLWRIKSISYAPGSTDYKLEAKYDYTKKRSNIISFDTQVREINCVGVLVPMFASDNKDDYYCGAFYNGLEFQKEAFSGTFGYSWQYKEGINHFFMQLGVCTAFNMNLGDYVVVTPNASVVALFDIITSSPAGGWAWNAGLCIQIKKDNNYKLGIQTFYQDNFIYSLRKTQGNYRYGTLGIGISIYNFDVF